MKIIKKTLVLLLIIFVVAQLFRPQKNDGDIASVGSFFKETNPPDDVKIILKNACFDCHTNLTKYPWYNVITPVNYWLNSHIEEGKEHFNMSNWVGNSIKRKDHKFEELIEMVTDKKMPLNSYTWMHKDAELTEAQIKAIVDWAEKVRLSYDFKPKPE